ncbi:SGNH/GDSL hydrolase family protein [Sphingobacteriales bacterium UPWRP_1]|nr:hypothetical protein BVG80_00425 [Sphingobacteriales bacterium TSM_CSM]PSJ72014.1 SGNH/GDSL hydrolase family protein [Sphingobacteriales bacterium UPWRP_1]
MVNRGRFFFRQYPKLTLLVFLLLFSMAALYVTEMWLYYLGFQPGLAKRGWYLTPADSLVETKDFYTNNLGLYVANAEAYYRHNPQDEPPYCINSLGFRTAELNEKTDTAKQTILLLGDSFAWGGGAEPLERSFADLLNQNSRFRCLNTGIPGTDPAQYAEIARLYTPLVQPDVVVCTFFTGNDLMYDTRPVQAGYQLFYWTNAGALIGYPPEFLKGTAPPFSSAQEAYRFVADHYTLWNNKHNPVKQFCARYRTTTLIWYVMRNLIAAQPADWFKLPVSVHYLHQIEEIARQNKAAFLLLLIPTIDEADFTAQRVLNRYQKKLPGIQLHLPPNLSSDYYLPMPNGHLNNAGHRFYAQYITALLDSLRQQKATH